MNIDELRKKLGKKAKDLRMRSHRKQKEIAEIIGVYPSDLSSFENSGQKLGLEKILHLFDVLGYELAPSEKKNTLIYA